MKPADQLWLQFDPLPVLQARYPNVHGWMVKRARTSWPVHQDERAREPAIWVCACGKVMTGIKGATQ